MSGNSISGFDLGTLILGFPVLALQSGSDLQDKGPKKNTDVLAVIPEIRNEMAPPKVQIQHNAFPPSC
ncbi:hypothetical protein MUK42_11613 [Musa troglodytarum]|uniref:Uncharacterized protein n=1 Tax=Musa troglodytarum TaxID=320322 RepID=A0A9E7GMC1_9LILI|nr:hypothetical protein MUK42_11613 [Musa troglodytarum]